nr:MAG TPA: hypothetical protein [Caudoviricetes sp.]
MIGSPLAFTRTAFVLIFMSRQLMLLRAMSMNCWAYWGASKKGERRTHFFPAMIFATWASTAASHSGMVSSMRLPSTTLIVPVIYRASSRAQFSLIPNTAKVVMALLQAVERFLKKLAHRQLFVLVVIQCALDVGASLFGIVSKALQLIFCIISLAFEHADIIAKTLGLGARINALRGKAPGQLCGGGRLKRRVVQALFVAQSTCRDAHGLSPGVRLPRRLA